MTKIKGRLHYWCETGTEGVVWAIQKTRGDYQYIVDEKGFRSQKHLNMIEKGDFLHVFNEDGSVYWEGIVPYSRTNFSKFVDPENGAMPYCLWARMFLDERKALLLKTVKNDS